MIRDEAQPGTAEPTLETIQEQSVKKTVLDLDKTGCTGTKRIKKQCLTQVKSMNLGY